MDLKAFTYSFPFKMVFKTNTRTFKSREGVILEFNDGSNIALGEAAPLPGFSSESLPEVKTQLAKNYKGIKELFFEDLSLESLQIFYRKNDILPSLQFALDTLAVDHLSQKNHSTAQDFLFDEFQTTLKVNIVISIKSANETLNQVRKSVDQGFRTVKIKVGLNFQNEYKIIKKIHDEFPELTIRLDANKGWNLKEAIGKLSKLNELGIEYCEEPLSDPSLENLKQLRSSVTIPIALDESLLTFKNLEVVAPYISVMVIKPMIFGSLSKLFATNRTANNHGIKVIYTTSLESGIGRTMTAILAAGLGNSNSAHGLGTGSLLKMDVWHDGTYINNGSVYLPDRFELGKRYHSNHKYLELDRIDL